MAQVSIGEVRWGMVRRVLRRGRTRFSYGEVRTRSRHDESHFAWLVSGGFFEGVAAGWYRVTAKGVAAAELGLYEV